LNSNEVCLPFFFRQSVKCWVSIVDRSCLIFGQPILGRDKVHAGTQRIGLCAGGKLVFRLPEPSAECRIKKLIICSFADGILSARTADDSSTNADVYSCPTCTKPLVRCWPMKHGIKSYIFS